jgi:hypothetical protein
MSQRAILSQYQWTLQSLTDGVDSVRDKMRTLKFAHFEVIYRRSRGTSLFDATHLRQSRQLVCLWWSPATIHKSFEVLHDRERGLNSKRVTEIDPAASPSLERV